MNIVIELGVKSSPEKIIYKGRSNFSKSYNYFSMKTFTVGCKEGYHKILHNPNVNRFQNFTNQ